MSHDIEKEFDEFVRSLVERKLLNQDEASKLQYLVENYSNFQEKFGQTKVDLYIEISKQIAEKLLENIVENKGGKFFDEKILQLFKKVPDLKLPDLKGLKPSDLKKERIFQLAVIGLTPDELITTGYLKAKPEDPYLPTNLCISLTGLGSLLDKEELRNAIIKHVQWLYGLAGESVPFRLDITEDERDEFYHKLKSLLSSIKRSFHEGIENLQDSLTFYDRSMGLYSQDSGSINIFSTSSGLVIPEEYRGDIKKEKNSYRRKYFDDGVASKNAHKLLKYYQWDSINTAEELWENFLEKGRSEEYKMEAVEVLSKFLRVPNLEITEAPFRNEPWKEFFTLVTDRTLVFSERGEIRKINHGLMIEDELLKSKKEIYEEISDLLGNKSSGIIDNIKSYYKRGECRTFKSLDEICTSPEEATENARDIVALLLDKGRILKKKKEKSTFPVALEPSKYEARKKKDKAPKIEDYEVILINETEAETKNFDATGLKNFLHKHKKRDYKIWINEIKEEYFFDEDSIEKIQPTPLAVFEELLINSPNILTTRDLFNKFAFVDRIFDGNHPLDDAKLVWRWISNLRSLHKLIDENIETVHTIGYKWKGGIKCCIIRWKYKKKRKSREEYYYRS